MKKALLLLLACLLLALPALGEEASPELITLTTPDGMTVTQIINCPEWESVPDAELVIQHYCACGEYDKAFILNEQLASMGDTDAMYRLGCHYLNGLGTAQDDGAALQCFTAAKEAGSSDAALALILARLNGWGMTRDALGAAAELTALAQDGQFQYELALLYLHGAYDIPAHEATALYWFDQCCGQRKTDDPLWYEQQLSAFRAASPASLTDRLPVQYERWADPVAQADMALELGLFWQEGRGGVSAPQTAEYWYEFTIALGLDPQSSWAHEALADMYLSGALDGVNVEKAIAHLLAYTLHGGGYGAYRVGMLYWDGVTGADGTVYLARNRETALTYLTRAADAGHLLVCAFLGDAYRTGDGVPASAHTAAHYYSLGLDDAAGSMDCYAPLLEMYRQGLLHDRAVMDEIYAGLKKWHGTDHQLAILLAEDWLNGKTAEDGTVLVAQDRKAACELMEYFHDFHLSLHDTPEVFFLNWLGWFYSGNAPEAIQRDYAKALSFYLESAQQGNGYAMAMAGVFYQNGRGVPVDHMSARAWYRAALAAGYSGAQGYLDALNAAYPEYPADLAVTLSTPDGLTLSHIVNRTGEPDFTDAELYLYGLCVAGRWAEALNLNQQLADLGDVDAMARLGVQYTSGCGAVQDDAQALTWLLKASVAGSRSAVFHLACMYHNGWGASADAARAAALLESLNDGSEPLTTRPQPDPASPEAVNPTILLRLAAFWTEGRGGQVDNTQAACWYEYLLTSFPEETAACYPLAVLLRDGSAGTPDAQRAVTLFCRANAMEEAACMFDTGVTTEDGRILLAPNAIVAAALHTWASTSGDPNAGALLGDIFRDGGIVPANANQAAAFYWAARENPYCADQLTALMDAGLVTDAALLRQMAENPAE